MLAGSWYGGICMGPLLYGTDGHDSTEPPLMLCLSPPEFMLDWKWAAEGEPKGWKRLVMLLKLCWLVPRAPISDGGSSWQMGLSWKSSPSMGM